ncbi:MAG: HAMP domain-containing protein [Firmicutes bacterium]|nr:HAMP domain-containing protein [Bacillota bacterium]
MRVGIQKKIAGGYVLIVFLIVVSTTVIYFKTNQKMLSYTMTAHQYHLAEMATLGLFLAIRNEETVVRRYFQNKDPQYVEAFRNAQQQIVQEKGILEELLVDDEEALRCLQERILPTADYLDALLEEALTENKTELAPYWLSFPGLTEDFIQAEVELSSILNQRHTEAMFAQREYLKQSYRLTMLILLILALLAIALGLLIARGITGPLKKLMQGIEGLKSGTYRQIEEVCSNDELRALIMAFNQMADTIELNRLELQKRNEELQAQGEELIAQNEEILAQQKGLEELVDKLMKQEDLLSRLFKFAQSLTRTIQVDQLAAIVLEGLMKESKAQVALFMLFDPKTEKMRLIKSAGRESALEQITNKLYLPLIYNREVRGQIVLGRLVEFSAEEQRLLRALSAQIVVALDNALSHQTVQQALEKMQEIDELKTELLNTVSHELRTPLTSILGFSELLLKNSVDEGKTPKYVQMINKESIRLSQLVNNFLDLQRIETGQLSLNRRLVNLYDVIADVVATFQGAGIQHTIEIRLAKDLPLVNTDPEQLARVLENLLSNALKYSPQAYKVEVEVEQISTDLIAIAVKDYGLGIPPSEQEAIFKPFYRVDHSEWREIGGTGLGLAIAYQTARSLGGELRVDSQYGKGSTFTFNLPIAVP